MKPNTYDLLITEGESDCHTLAGWGFPVIGVSGSQGWLPEYAELSVVENAKRVFVCEDEDEDGQKFTTKVLKSLPQALIMRFEGVKDPSELHLKYAGVPVDELLPHPFTQSIDIAIQAATLERAMRQPKQAKDKPAVMREEAFHGVAGKIVKLLHPQLEACREAILVNVLSSAGVLFQHSAYSKVAADVHYPAEYYLTVGNSAVSRKGTTTNAVLEILERAQNGFKNRILNGLSTGQGLIAALIKNKPDNEEQTEETIAEPIASSVLIEVSEFSGLLAVMKRDENTLSAVLRDAWDGRPLSVLTRNQPLRVKNVSLATIAHITGTELLRRLTSTDIANGFANRYIFIWMERNKFLPKSSLEHLDSNEIVRELNAALQSAQNAGEIHRDSEAEELWAEEYKRLSTRGDSIVDALLSRAEAHVMRVSLLYALLDGAREIRKEHLKAALAVWDYSESSVKYVFGNAVDSDAQKVLQKLEQSGAFTTGELRSQVFHQNKTAKEVEEIMEALEQQRRVIRCPKEFKTGTKTAWDVQY